MKIAATAGRLAAGILLGLSFAAPALAENAPVESYTQIKNAGFEVKSVTLVPSDQVDIALDSKGNDPAVIVTLQKARQTAVCYFGMASWINLTTNAMGDENACAIY
jgi:hypothetical protein